MQQEGQSKKCFLASVCASASRADAMAQGAFAPLGGDLQWHLETPLLPPLAAYTPGASDLTTLQEATVSVPGLSHTNT